MTYALLLVDDQPAFLRMAKEMLERDPALRVVALSTSGEEALSRLDHLHPDALLLDVHLPGINGFETARRAVRQAPGLSIVLFSAVEDPEYESLARAVGALGFLPKKRLAARTVRAMLGST